MTLRGKCQCGHDIKFHSSKDGCNYGVLNECLCDHYRGGAVIDIR